MGLLSKSGGLTSHGSKSERRLLTQERGRAGHRPARGLGPATKHGKPTPKNPGKGKK